MEDDVQEQGRGVGDLIPRYPVFGSNQRHELDSGHVDSGHVNAVSFHPRPKLLTSTSTRAYRTLATRWDSAVVVDAIPLRNAAFVNSSSMDIEADEST